MDGHRFDALARTLATRTNRRRAISSMLGIGAGIIAAAGPGIQRSVTAGGPLGTCQLNNGGDGVCAAEGAICSVGPKNHTGICKTVAGPQKSFDCVCSRKKG